MTPTKKPSLYTLYEVRIVKGQKTLRRISRLAYTRLWALKLYRHATAEKTQHRRKNWVVRVAGKSVVPAKVREGIYATNL